MEFFDTEFPYISGYFIADELSRDIIELHEASEVKILTNP